MKVFCILPRLESFWSKTVNAMMRMNTRCKSKGGKKFRLGFVYLTATDFSAVWSIDQYVIYYSAQCFPTPLATLAISRHEH